MKTLTALLLMLSVFALSAQDCTYSVDKTDPYTKLRTKSLPLQIMHFNTEIYTLYFSLIEISNDSTTHKFVDVYYSIPKITVCFNESCKMRVLLKDSSVVDIPYFGKTDCAKTAISSAAGITYSTGACSFELNDTIIKQLQAQPFINIRINYIDGFIDYPIATAIKKTPITKRYDLTLNPQEYFLRFLKCIAN